MEDLRWILAYFLAALAWLYFPFLCSFIVSSEPGFLAASVVLFLNPIISFGVFFLIMPPDIRSSLVAGIIGYFVVCIAGTLLLSFLSLAGGGRDFYEALIFEPLGTIVGAGIAYKCIPIKVEAS